MNRLSHITSRLHRIATENPCGWSERTLDTIASGLELLLGERTKNGVTLMELSEYYKVTIRTIERWRQKYDDFPQPIDPYAKTLSFPVDKVVDWKQSHSELF